MMDWLGHMKRLIRDPSDATLDAEARALANDPRWQRFNDRGYACPCCDLEFNGVFDFGFDHPDIWPHGNRSDSGVETLTAGDDRLGTDLCAIEHDRFIRCVLPLPIRGSDAVFCFGPWASVHPDNFDLYVTAEYDQSGDRFDGCFAWLMNDLPGLTGKDSVACNLVPQSDNMRPALYAQDGPVKLAQDTGISFDELLDIYAACGTDIRPHLQQG